MTTLDEQLLFESTPRHCKFYKASDGKWYLELADHGEPDTDDWEDYYGPDGGVEDSTTYGPFASEDAAMDHLDNFSNPGSFFTDASGKRPPPQKSPNGRPVESPVGRSSSTSFRWGNPSATDASFRDYFLRPVATKSTPVAAKSNKGNSKKTYKIYGGHHDVNLGSSPLHTRVGGKVYVPLTTSKFKKGQSANVSLDNTYKDKLKVSDPESGHTQTWSKKESFERVLRSLIRETIQAQFLT